LFYRFTPWSHPPNLVVIHEPVLEISCGQTQCAQTDTQTHTDRHTPMTTRPCGLRRAGNHFLTVKSLHQFKNFIKICQQFLVILLTVKQTDECRVKHSSSLPEAITTAAAYTNITLSPF